jgi:hypothetical protein
LGVVPLDVCGVEFGSPYMYMRDAIRNMSWRSFFRNTKECLGSLKGYHPKGMWNMKYNYF